MIKFFAIALAVIMFFLPVEAIQPIARPLVPGIALLATGIFPSMTLTVGAMLTTRQNPQLIQKRYNELKEVLRILAASFALAVVCIILLSAAVAVNNVPNLKPIVAAYAPHIIMCSFGFVVALLIGRGIAIVKIYFHILDLNKKQALLNARKDVDDIFDKAKIDGRLNAIVKRQSRPKKLAEDTTS